ncbi:MAG: protoporphyrinogen oxidase [Chloroflexota bacterium]|nr:protoporphyrinogen oxidase [Chloroflexota bacterium]
MKKVAIIGGGIAGLATAYYLHTRGNGAVAYTLIESAPNFGGKIASAREQGFVVEGGPDSFLTTKPAALALCRDLGLGDELIGTNDAGRKVFVWSRGKLRAMPDGVMLIIPTKLMPFVMSSLISPLGKLRMGLDAFIPPRADDGDESLSHFVRRRLGAEALDKIAEPMIAGIYVADAENLSLQSTFPRFLDMEKKYGGLLRGVIAQKRASNGNGKTPSKPAPSTPKTTGGSMFMTLRGGLQQMTDALVARLNRPSLISNRRVVGIAPGADGYRVTLSDGAHLSADEIVFATPAYATADLVAPIAPALADALRAIRYVSTATVSLGFKRAELTHPLDGFGFVVPRSEKRKIIACSWSSTKFNHRAPAGYALVRAFIGGAHADAERLVAQNDAALAQMAREELRAMMGITATPVLTKVYRWSKANPQYEVGHLARIAEIDRLAQAAGVHLAGGAYHGVGIPDCIESGARVAEKILKPGK